jgi:chromosome partitioning protein spoOJ
MKDNKRPMGRGLSAILNTEFKNNVTKTEETKDIVGNIIDIPLEKIIPNKSQPRSYFGDQALSELAQSIESLGIIQPITVKKQDDKFFIISGERRFRASKIVGLKTIPAYVRLADDKELLEMALVENIQREDLNAIEIALTYQRFLEELEMTQEQLSQRIGKERSTITNAIRLLKLPPVIQDAIRNGVISAGHGRAILSLDDEKLQFELLTMIIKEKLNVRQAELLANSLKNPKQKKETQQKENIPNHYKKVQKNLSDLLDLKVEIKTASNGKKGKLILDFKNEKELEDILTYFNQSF